MLRNTLSQMSSDQLRRVLDAPLETWDIGGYYDPRSRTSCLIGHAHGVRSAESYRNFVREYSREKKCTSFLCVERRFDRLVFRFGIRRIVRALKLSALALLEERASQKVGLTPLVPEQAGV